MGRLLDSNVLLDLITADPKWLPWSTRQFKAARRLGKVMINPIIYAEIAPAFDSQAALDRWLRPDMFEKLRLPYEAGWQAALAFTTYRNRGGTKSSPLPDFYIGAHAETEGLTLVTRDPARYRTYFRAIRLIVPDRT